ncbi:hypothetical protein RRG08_040811 [Elysia crispata]|uniref:Uncharacterized protein n=1 Tax=Elysia crispata TaxID=231223 RepID=A0AAE0Z993_9GAST|nr:hypothetical protein RRG08_040811 [Elysia crispata]
MDFYASLTIRCLVISWKSKFGVELSMVGGASFAITAQEPCFETLIPEEWYWPQPLVMEMVAPTSSGRYEAYSSRENLIYECISPPYTAI